MQPFSARIKYSLAQMLGVCTVSRIEQDQLEATDAATKPVVATSWQLEEQYHLRHRATQLKFGASEDAQLLRKGVCKSLGQLGLEQLQLQLTSMSQHSGTASCSTGGLLEYMKILETSTASILEEARTLVSTKWQLQGVE